MCDVCLANTNPLTCAPIPGHFIYLFSLHVYCIFAAFYTMVADRMDWICVFLFQISSHVKAIDAIYQGTDFMGIRNISFMVKRIRVSVIFKFTFWMCSLPPSELIILLLLLLLLLGR